MAEKINLASGSSYLRKFKKIPIFIVDSHNDVMVFIYRAIASRHLPLYGNVLLHFDSHPDMVVNSELNAQTAYKKQELLNELSIENWIIPACYTGQFGHIIWMKNSWAKQIGVGCYEFVVGSFDDKIGVDLPHSYFIGDGSYIAKSKLENVRKVKLDVCEMDTQNLDTSILFRNFEKSNRCILDIDLDYFSTANPFLEVYPLANCYEQLKLIFKFEMSDDVEKASAVRREQLNALKMVFKHLQMYRSLARSEMTNGVLSSETLDLIETLRCSLCKYYEDSQIDWLQILDAGLTTDDQGLPHHISSETELEKHYERFAAFLKKLPFFPVCVTIACSSVDDYTPQDQMPIILDRVLKILHTVYVDDIHMEAIRFDGTENFNVMHL